MKVQYGFSPLLSEIIALCATTFSEKVVFFLWNIWDMVDIAGILALLTNVYSVDSKKYK
jgi:hypothetical protein